MTRPLLMRVMKRTRRFHALYVPRHRQRIGCLPLLALCLTCIVGIVTSNGISSAAPPPTQTAVPGSVSGYPKLIDALQNGNIETAIAIIQSIDKPQADDVKMLAMGVRLMLDHLYVIDATDFQMPTVRTKMDAALAVADRAIQADPNSPDAWAAKALALNWAYQNDDAVATISYARSLNPSLP